MRFKDLTVVKVGGSLLSDRNLQSQIKRLLFEINGPCVLIVGGGEFVEEIRRLQPLHCFSDEDAHWMAIDLMSVTAKMVSTMAGLPIAQQWSDIDSIRGTTNAVVVDVRRLSGLQILEQSWNLTSDSLSAWLAHQIQATRLILAKSKPLPVLGISLETLSKTGEIDPLFPELSKGVPLIEWCHLNCSSGLETFPIMHQQISCRDND